MAYTYPAPKVFDPYLFNPDDYDEAVDIPQNDDINLSNYVKKDGDTMTGLLTIPEVHLTKIKFTNNQSVQNKAFTDANSESLNNIQNNTQKIIYDNELEETTIINPVNTTELKINGNSQTVAYTNGKNDDIINTKQKTQGLLYDEGLTKTTIQNNCHINSLTCSNFNTSHLSNTTSNLQSQISDNRLNIESMDTRIGNVNDDIELINSDILTINNTLDNLTNNVDLNEIENEINVIENDINAIENDINVLQQKTTHIQYRTKGAIVDDILHVKDILLDNVSSLGTPTIYFKDSSEQTSAFTSSHKTKLENMPVINNIVKLGADYIADGVVNNGEFNTLNGVTGNIQNQLNSHNTKISNIENSRYILQYSGQKNEVLNNSLNWGVWLNGNHTWAPMNGVNLPEGMYIINLELYLYNINDFHKLKSRIQIHNFAGSKITESYYIGRNLENSTSRESDFHFNLSFPYYCASNNFYNVRIYSEYHFKGSLNCDIDARLTILKTTAISVL